MFLTFIAVTLVYLAFIKLGTLFAWVPKPTHLSSTPRWAFNTFRRLLYQCR